MALMGDAIIHTYAVGSFHARQRRRHGVQSGNTGTTFSQPRNRVVAPVALGPLASGRRRVVQVDDCK